jgi:hypothetical protein
MTIAPSPLLVTPVGWIASAVYIMGLLASAVILLPADEAIE